VILIAWLGTAMAAIPADAIPDLRLDARTVTVSGMSAGGYVAHQLHVAYSDLFTGVGIIAGGPYGCAEGSLAKAMSQCMGAAVALPAAPFVRQVEVAAAAGRIAPLQALRDDPVWLFRGTLDRAVAAPVADALAALYGQLVDPAKLVYIKDIAAAHLFPTLHEGGPCTQSTVPFIGNCGFDASGKLLNHLYGRLAEPGSADMDHLRRIVVAKAATAGLMDRAYLYTPADCIKGRHCRLHLVLHGCGQSAATLGMDFIRQSGYLPWAESNGIVLLYPQVQPSAVNPYACFDWWGYSGKNYRYLDGVQMRTMVGLVKAVLNPRPHP